MVTVVDDFSLHSDFWISCKGNNDPVRLHSSDTNHWRILGKKPTSIWKVTIEDWDFETLTRIINYFYFLLSTAPPQTLPYWCCHWTISLAEEFCLVRRNIFAHSKYYILKHKFIAARKIRLEGIENLQMFLVTLCSSNDCTV